MWDIHLTTKRSLTALDRLVVIGELLTEQAPLDLEGDDAIPGEGIVSIQDDPSRVAALTYPSAFGPRLVSLVLARSGLGEVRCHSGRVGGDHLPVWLGGDVLKDVVLPPRGYPPGPLSPTRTRSARHFARRNALTTEPLLYGFEFDDTPTTRNTTSRSGGATRDH
jgi:hypothetical protein